MLFRSSKAQTTRHRLTGILTSADCQYLFVDLPGYQTRHAGALNRALNRAATEGARDADALNLMTSGARAQNPGGDARRQQALLRHA